jgi:hypothetical protein
MLRLNTCSLDHDLLSAHNLAKQIVMTERSLRGFSLFTRIRNLVNSDFTFSFLFFRQNVSKNCDNTNKRLWNFVLYYSVKIFRRKMEVSFNYDKSDSYDDYYSFTKSRSIFLRM